MKKSMIKLRDMLCMELDEIAEKGELSAGDLQSIHTLTDTIKNIDKIEMLGGEESYSRGYSRGDHRESYRDGDSYRNSYASRHWVRGHYSRDDGSDMMMQRIDEMLDDNELTSAEKTALRKAKEIMMK